MAEQVQATLDRMVPALRDLMDRGIFSEVEVKGIVSRRREQEYLIRRRATRKSDYLTYIKAEENLERLRELRKERIVARIDASIKEKKKENSKNPSEKALIVSLKKKHAAMRKFSIGDGSIIQHVHLLYTNSKRKWSDDLSFVLQHADFAKRKKSFKALGRIYTEALQLHPRNASLWIEAASFEYFGYSQTNKDDTTNHKSKYGSIKDARILLQRGLRINEQSQELWLQSFNLELHYIQKIRGREELLKLNSDESKDPKSVVVSADELNKDFKIARIVYNNAIKAVPDIVKFRLQFIDLLKLFPQTQPMIDYIMSTIERDFEDNEEAWILRARHNLENLQERNQININVIRSTFSKEEDSDEESLYLDEDNGNATRKRKRDKVHDDGDSSKQSSILEILDDATDKVHTTKMFLYALKFLQWYSSEYLDNDYKESRRANGMSKASELACKILKKMDQISIDIPKFIVECADLLVEMKLPMEALRILKSATQESCQSYHHILCWIKYSEINAIIGGSIGEQYSVSILREALKVIPMHCNGYDHILIRLFTTLLSMNNSSLTSISNDDIRNELPSLFEKIVLLNQPNQMTIKKELNGEFSTLSIASVAYQYLEYLATINDMNTIRDLYKKVSVFYSSLIQVQEMSNEDVETMYLFYTLCISAETNCKSAYPGEKRNNVFLREMYGTAIKICTTIGATSLADDFSRRKQDVFF